MYILVIGVNHRTAPVEIREKIAFDEQTLPEAITQLRNMKSIFEDVIVSTCNRTEIYVVSDQLHTGIHFTKSFISDWFNLDKEDFLPYLYIKENNDAIEHLFHVACGLDSMVLGETQILGQIRDSFLLAQDYETTGTFFNQLFREAITVAKRAQAETGINDTPLSISYIAVEMLKQHISNFEDRHILLVGAGKMSDLALKHLKATGGRHITIVNRTYEKAKRLAERFDAEAKRMTDLNDLLIKSDIVITSTSSRDYVIDLDNMKNIMKKRAEKPLFMVDMAVPRDVHPDVQHIPHVYLFDIDKLESQSRKNAEERMRLAYDVKKIIKEQTEGYNRWMQTLGVVPLITALRKKALSIQAETVSSIERKIPSLTEREKKVIRKHTKSIINQLLRDPIQKIKESAGQEDAESAFQFFKDLFQIELDQEAEKSMKSEGHQDKNNHDSHPSIPIK
ncbi:glutamyl-tRNA reductase [Terrilactibacillus sp. BCM23-1]|uniref:Glutamyl-tRNA reductase n=1 Tax=Terrilactibacillus tamarindi TaxID=2599694 RepID=A0A6N8CNL8_9BACI|nr:glutamyl-tRNA reductase [Terrilactibacillus tamarindi]MTT31729.1 glutamyl-tRNA reductase [Terrilactibacillus tamarindi]